MQTFTILRHNKKSKTIIGTGIILIALYFGYSAVLDSVTYYRGVDIVAGNMDYYSTHRVRMIGDIANDTLISTEKGYSFNMEFNGTFIPVIYNGMLPQTLRDKGRVVVIGTIDNGIFQAAEMNVKCPTKYQPTSTPFGTFTASSGFVEGKRVVFVARHGMRHKFLPHEVNYRANIYALKKLGVRQVFSFCMAGALSKEYVIGDIVIPDQFIDMTHGRSNTFFGEGNSVYVSMADPFCPLLSSFASGELTGAGIKTHPGGTYVCVQGPHFSTRAESSFYSGIGNIIGMTAATEAKLAREAGLCYSVLASVVDHDTCSMGMKDMINIVTSAKFAARRLVAHVPATTLCNCVGSMTGSVISRTGPHDAVVGRSFTRSMFND